MNEAGIRASFPVPDLFGETKRFDAIFRITVKSRSCIFINMCLVIDIYI